MDNPETMTPANDRRLEQARDWLHGLGVKVPNGFHAVAGDASFRRYFRLQADGMSRILMDAPPPGEDVRPFIDIDQRLRSSGLHAPDVFHADVENGFVLLEDLGDELYRDLLEPISATSHFPKLFGVLESMATEVDARGLAKFDDAALRAEMNLFPDWYLDHHRSQLPRARFDLVWEEFCGHIIASAQEQPQCFVHRDFHSCNLLKTPGNTVGIIDFQDAVSGPLSYDFISLIWDRYISWPREQIEEWMESFRQMLDLDIRPLHWQRYCDLMGLQRNIKVVGIFARLYYRDSKSGYIEMIPRFYDYVTTTLRLYPEFSELLDILEKTECAP